MLRKVSQEKNNLDRRSFLKLSGTTAAVAATAAGSVTLGASTPAAAAMMGRLNRAASLPKASGARVVVVGGGWSGLTMAKYLKKENSSFDVVLVEPNAMFMSCPLSNLWLGGVIGIDLLLHSFIDAARNNNYVYLQGTLVDVDREKKRVYTDKGYIDYHYLVLAPGIDYNYASVGVKDPGDEVALRQTYPAAFKPGSEHLSLKAKLDDFEEGNFVLNVPMGNYRCLPGPYERACLIAAYFKKEGIKGKVILLDPNEKPTIKGPGFLAAFSELYKGILEYKTATKIEGVDLGKKRVMTEFGEVSFADASIYPRVRAATLIEDLGLVDPKSLQFEANIDTLRYHIKGDEHVYVTGDARPMPFSKSGNTSNSEAHIVARMIAGHAKGKSVAWESPNTICYSMVGSDPQESIMVDAKYKHDGKGGGWNFTDVKMTNKRSADLAKANIEWGKGLYRDMFS